ncbi:MAG: 3-isopropylmalate dehydratase large subunit [Alphaproteobacteria bacterium MarineAlpha9_Bin1]|nr:MAG: 3-isopropylmalate dehydratase large subunit [Alphaproteobacteria bacterium MarineAlpha9_Bin1]
MKKTLFDKIWESHLVEERSDDSALIYIDRHLIHEVTSPQAFEGLRTMKRKVRRPDLTLAVADHNVPTEGRVDGIKDEIARIQVETLEKNVKEFEIPYLPLLDPRQGIVHVVGPEQGFTLPGCTIVCGDSHTSTHGAFGALAFGIGTSEVEHVFATQTLMQKKPKTMLLKVEGSLSVGITSKDLALGVIKKLGASGGTGYILEYSGKQISNLSMEARMTLCNMSIEAGARAALIAPDEKTVLYLKDKPLAPKGDLLKEAKKSWASLFSDEMANYDMKLSINASTIEPHVTWGTSPEDVISINDCIPNPEDAKNDIKKKAMQDSLKYMGLVSGQKLTDIAIDKVFIGSCTNSRIEDLREAALVVEGKKVSAKVHAMVVPGSGLIKLQAEKEGLAQVFIDAGFDWREPGCSMCLGMNPDQLKPKERCASTSNRNFRGRQGRDGRTHLLSPGMAAGAAVAGHFIDITKS